MRVRTRRSSGIVDARAPRADPCHIRQAVVRHVKSVPIMQLPSNHHLVRRAKGPYIAPRQRDLNDRIALAEARLPIFLQLVLVFVAARDERRMVRPDGHPLRVLKTLATHFLKEIQAWGRGEIVVHHRTGDYRCIALAGHVYPTWTAAVRCNHGMAARYTEEP